MRKKLDSVNEAYFNSIDSIEKAYWLGFMFADGYNQDNRKCIRLGLKGDDKYIIEEFKKDIETKSPVINDKKRNYSSIAVYSEKLCESLNLHGCVRNKTFLLKFPKLSNEFHSHFIRGYFDGDGCVSFSKIIHNNKEYKYLRVIFVGTLDFLNGISNILHNEINISKPNITKSTHSDIYYLTYSKVRDCKLIEHYLYKDAKFFLQRKKEKFLQA